MAQAVPRRVHGALAACPVRAGLVLTDEPGGGERTARQLA